MEHAISGFDKRMKFDKVFRRKVLTAWKTGDLAGVLQEEGFTFLLEDLDRELPLVRTSIRAGGCHCHHYVCSM